MKNLKIENGDIVFNNLGKLIFIEDKEQKLQSILMRLKTIKGDLFYNIDYGRERLDNLKITNSSISKIKSILADCLYQDDDINNFNLINITRKERNIYIDLEIILKDGTILSIKTNL